MHAGSRRGPVPTRIPPPILGKIPFPPPSRLCKLILVVVPALCSFYKIFPHVLNWKKKMMMLSQIVRIMIQGYSTIRKRRHDHSKNILNVLLKIVLQSAWFFI